MERKPERRRRENDLEAWNPKTALGRAVKTGKVKSIDEIIDNGIVIKEPEIVDALIPGLEVDFLSVGQSKGKFGGGKRKAFKVTQKKQAEGSKIKFTALAIVGNRAGCLGMGVGSSGETVPTRNKAEKAAKLNMIKVHLGCGSWECSCNDPHTLPFKVTGSQGSVEVTLMPAPKGTGLAVGETCKQMLSMLGVKDAWSYTRGQTATRINLARATFKALKNLRSTRL